MDTNKASRTTVAMMVAHPDDETLWAGGTLLMHPDFRCHIGTLCRAGDPDRAPRFSRVLECLGATGGMADLDDGPAQNPLDRTLARQTIRSLLGDTLYDLIITHGPYGEYTYHRRHVEVSAAVSSLWCSGEVHADELWLFAYSDNGGNSLPHAAVDAHCRVELSPMIWREKYRIVHEIYGFAAESWEVRTTPSVEAFWQFTSPEALVSWLSQQRQDHENITAL